MTAPSVVWMIHALTTLDGVKGKLTLEERALVFRPSDGRSGETVIPLGKVRRVRRAMGSPVMEVQIAVPNAPPIIGFYFVKPPSLTNPTRGFQPFGRYLARRRAIQALRAGNARKGHEVERWVAALKGAQQGERPAQDQS